MVRFCHRCGGDLPPGPMTIYCSHCGAPQLHMAEGSSVQTSEVEGEEGAPPPPMVREIEWRSALRSGAAVAAVGVVLHLLSARLPSVSIFSSLWIFGGPLIALSLYQREQPRATMTAGVGARIGMVVGLGTVAGLGAALAVIGVVARYGLHRMAGFDAAMAAWMKVQVDHALQANPVPPEIVRYFYSPEFRTGFVLVLLAISGLFLLGAATLAGALGGLLRARRAPTAQAEE